MNVDRHTHCVVKSRRENVSDADADADAESLLLSDIWLR